MSLSASTWDAVLDEAQIYDSNERARLEKALTRASSLLHEHFQGRLHAVHAFVRTYSIKERRLPLDVEVECTSDEEAALLEKELAELVLGPVYSETRVSMPIEVVPPSPGLPPDRSQVPGLLYPR